MNSIYNIIDRLPDWLKIKQEGSNGYKFLDSIAQEIDFTKNSLYQMLNNIFITTADITIPDYVYKHEIPTAMSDFEILTNEAEISNTIYQFFQPSESKKIIIDKYNKIMYSNTSEILNYTIKLPNGESKKISGQFIKHHIWNVFDEFALLFGLTRLDGETNQELYDRIISRITNMPGSDTNAIKHGISVELGINEEEIDVKPLYEIVDFINKNSVIEFVNYVNKMSSIYDLATVKWDQEFKNNNFATLSYLPRLYTNGLVNFSKEYIQSGIGDGDDLMLKLPQDTSGVQRFKVRLGLIGKKTKEIKYYPRHDLKLKVYAKGKYISNVYKPKDISYTIVASQQIPVEFKVRAESEYDREINVDLTNNSEINNVSIVSGNKIENLGGSDNKYIKIVAELESNESQTETPVISYIKINYIKNENGQNVNAIKYLTLDVPNNNIDNSGTDIKLSKYAFYYGYKDQRSWYDGTPESLQITSNGLRLRKTV